MILFLFDVKQASYLYKSVSSSKRFHVSVEFICFWFNMKNMPGQLIKSRGVSTKIKKKKI